MGWPHLDLKIVYLLVVAIDRATTGAHRDPVVAMQHILNIFKLKSFVHL